MPRTQYPQELIEQIRQAIDFTALVGRYTRINRKGQGLCPFHQEKHPSFAVDVSKGLWHCFGCQKGGDCFSFIIEAEGLSFQDSVKYLAFHAGIRLPQGRSINNIINKRIGKFQGRIKSINDMEQLFKNYERTISDDFSFQMRCLFLNPCPLEWTSKDYLKEQILNEKFDCLEEIIRNREATFEQIRGDVRHG